MNAFGALWAYMPVKGLYMPRGCAEGVIVYKIRDKKGGKQSL